ncbi:DUF397 domain-containing protein [Streptomyces sp. Ru72]|uniref:DUF397 domain-containing protein n=1 Tax=Streptomyces sp. Ru72 TaxID=2080747 RepID=UPI000CDD7492|nr:DUF397 domain-containing protein [Streptomyces sp. Ru72]POX48865.1 DUF397 domain-containing protein [Streptomyces sp. Ru72]
MSETLAWFKSSYSDSQGGACLEVAHPSSESRRTVHVRDSKLGARSPRFAVPADAWNAFLAYASGEA